MGATLGAAAGLMLVSAAPTVACTSPISCCCCCSGVCCCSCCLVAGERRSNTILCLVLKGRPGVQAHGCLPVGKPPPGLGDRRVPAKLRTLGVSSSISSPAI